jgi:hypothetical protein
VYEVGEGEVAAGGLLSEQGGEERRRQGLLDGAEALGSLWMAGGRPVIVEVALTDEQCSHA